jgi:Heavy-metal resistance protein CzcE
MKKLSVALFAATMVASSAVFALDQPVKLLGNQVSPDQATRTIVIKPNTKYVNVTMGDVVKFTANGKSFAWNFDGPPGVDNFKLNRVAPAGMLDRPVTVYISPSDESR